MAAVLPATTRAQTSLEAGLPRDRSLDAGGRHAYTLALGADACARLDIQTDLAARVTVRQPDGTSVVAIDDASREIAPQP